MDSCSVRFIVRGLQHVALRRGRRALGLSALLLLTFVSLTGCSRFRHKLANDYVYVTAKQTFLRDRVAAVSNRTAIVNNGERLLVLEHGRRFLRVQTDQGKQGWIDEKVVATQQVYDGFTTLGKDSQKDPSVASAVVRDDVYMHLTPGRKTDHLFRLNEGDKLQLLKRASLPKPVAGGPMAPPPSKSAAPPAAPEPPPMEDWWLVRDAQGRTGWILSRMMDVDAPDSIVRYAEGQRIVGAYVLNTVNDPEAPQDDKNIPQYLTVMSPYKAGLPYDFDQVRLFIWNVKRHRYETGFRDRNIEGYLPVQIFKAKDPTEKPPLGTMELPAFRYRLLTEDSPPVMPDPTTGAIVPGKTFTKAYRLEGNIVRRLLAPGEVPPEPAHPEPPKEKKEGKRQARHRR